MATPAQVKNLLLDFNALISDLLAERDRIATVASPTLPGGRSLWTVLPVTVQDSLKVDISSNIALAQTAINTVIAEIQTL